MKLLLISNSTNAGEPYLKYPMPRIDEFLGSVREVVFVPYAGITFSYAEYEAKVQARLLFILFFDNIFSAVQAERRYLYVT